MSAEVVRLPVEDQRSVDRVFDAAREAGLTDIIVIGYDRDGDLWIDLNVPDGPNALWLLELTKARLLHKPVKNIVEL